MAIDLVQTRREPPRLEAVQGRRRQLMGLLLLVFVLAAGGVVLFSYGSELIVDEPFELLDIGVLRVSFAALCIAFGVYVWDKERALTRIERDLIEERVRSATLSETVDELAALSRAGRAVASVLSAEDALILILQSAQELLGATEGSVLLLSAEGRVLRLVASVGLGDDITREVPVGESVAGWVAEFREPVIVGRPPHPRFQRFIPKDRDVRSAMSAPLFARGEPIGVLNVSISRGEREYSDRDLGALTILAEYAAIAITNARLFERQRAATARLEKLDADRREFLAIVTHDLRGPLTSILGYAGLLKALADVAPVEQRREYAEIIESQGKRMRDMVEQLILVSSMEEGSSLLAEDRLDIGELVDGAVAAFSGVLRDRSVLASVPPDVPLVSGDATAVRHILSNLLDNAVKYSEPETPVEVVVDRRPGEVWVSVKDRGPGIPDAVVPHIFERYRRGSEGASGFGLGLFIVRSLAEGQGGRVWASSRHRGGACVTFALRVAPEPTERREALARSAG